MFYPVINCEDMQHRILFPSGLARQTNCKFMFFFFFLQYGSGHPTWNIDHTSPQKHPDGMAVCHIS